MLVDFYRIVNPINDKTVIMNDSHKDKQPVVATDHRKGERRKVPTQGFAHITVVGWS